MVVCVAQVFGASEIQRLWSGKEKKRKRKRTGRFEIYSRTLETWPQTENFCLLYSP
jgi:hypothetical protein